jgi:hypothetical protein
LEDIAQAHVRFPRGHLIVDQGPLQ